MIDVFVLGVFVAYVKLSDLVTIGLRTGVYALFALTIVLVWLDSALDREAVWERLDREDDPDRLPCDGSAGGIGCETCGSRQRAARSRRALPALRQRRCIRAVRIVSSAPGRW